MNNPNHPFTPCNGAWVATTRTTGEGIGTYIQFQPTSAARGIWKNLAAATGRHIAAYSEMWEELNRCANFTPTLNDTQRHSMYVQMACHGRYGATFMGGGNTWDLEAWRKDVTWDAGLSFEGRCGQRYGDVSAQEVGAWLAGRLVNAFPDPNPSQRAAYLVEIEGTAPVRRHVTTGRAYQCLVDAGHPAARWFPAHFLDLIPISGEKTDANSCPSAAPDSDSPQPPAAPEEQLPPPQQQPPPEPRTWPEQQGSLGANTFTNPYNASGMGQKIQPYEWVDVACKVYAPQIQSANPDGYWYRIASSPWNGRYYAVANTFWNGDVPGQKPYTHNTDFAVPDC